MESHDGIFYPKENTSNVIKALVSNRIWEKNIDSLLKKYIKKDWNCIDCGAYIGSHALTMSQLCSKVFLFEPQPLIFDCLAMTSQSLKIKNWKINNFGLSNIDNGCIDFGTNNDGDGRILKNQKKNWKFNITIKTCKMDSLVLPKINFIKIDVEGHEYEVLEGAELLIKKDRPIIIMETFNTKKNQEKLIKFANENNYLINEINKENYLLLPNCI